MSSFYEMNSPPRSSAMRGLSARNSRTMKSLDKELSRLDSERKNKMKELNQATRHFLDLKLRPLSARSRETSPDRCSFVSLPAYARDRSSRSPSPSPSLRSPLDDLFPLTSPRNHKVVYRQSISTDGSVTSPNHLSPSSSPESKHKVLSKRQDDNQNRLKKSHSVTETSITHIAHLTLPDDRTGHATSKSNPTTPRTRTTSSVGIPTIVVSDGTPKLPNIVQPSVKPRASNSPVKKESKDSPRKGSTEIPHDNVINGSLHVPIRRSRSNSVPSISPSMQQLLDVAKTKPKSTTDDTDLHIKPPVQFRPRSSSVCVPYFDHLKDAPRRDSLIRKYIARPKIFHRTAKTIDQLITDLAKGIYHEDLLDPEYRSKPISAEEWESLKKCRYLRMPSKNDDVKGNTIDVEAIFAE